MMKIKLKETRSNELTKAPDVVIMTHGSHLAVMAS
jgi:hypothetical protein